MRYRQLGNPTDKAWIAGWDASIAFTCNPYKRLPQQRAFDSGKLAGQRQSDDDVRVLKLRLERLRPDSAARH